MNREQLEHAIRAACDVAEDTELWIFGSQAILGSYPDAPPELRGSMEADVSPRNHPEAVDRIDGSLGELSQFHLTHGFYVHGLPIEEAATLQPLMYDAYLQQAAAYEAMGEKSKAASALLRYAEERRKQPAAAPQ